MSSSPVWTSVGMSDLVAVGGFCEWLEGWRVDWGVGGVGVCGLGRGEVGRGGVVSM